jgi:hypothetical protein
MHPGCSKKSFADVLPPVTEEPRIRCHRPNKPTGGRNQNNQQNNNTMKTQSTIKTTSALFCASLLLSLSGHAGQNFSVSQTYSTDGYRTSNYGSQVTFAAFDNFTPPSANSRYNYSVTTKGTVTAKIPLTTFTAVDGTVTAKITNGNTPSLDASLKVAGITIMTLNNGSTLTYESPHFIKEVKSSGSAPFSIPIGGIPIPFVVNAKAKASVDVCLRATATLSSSTTPLPQVALSAGPVADIVATAEASLKVGVPGFSAGPGVIGTVKLGQSSLMANVNLVPTTRQKMVKQGKISRLVQSPGLNTDVSLVAQRPRIDGDIGLFVEAGLDTPFGPLSFRSDTLNIAHYSSPIPPAITLLGPAHYESF